MVSACSSLQNKGAKRKIKRFVPAERTAVELHGASDEDEAGTQLLQHYHTLTLQLYTINKQGPKPQSWGSRDILVRIRIADPCL
jgi:hypothetical protein